VKQPSGYANVLMQVESTVPEGLQDTVMGWLGWVKGATGVWSYKEDKQLMYLPWELPHLEKIGTTLYQELMAACRLVFSSGKSIRICITLVGRIKVLLGGLLAECWLPGNPSGLRGKVDWVAICMVGNVGVMEVVAAGWMSEDAGRRTSQQVVGKQAKS
jgi:hypothetical protein